MTGHHNALNLNADMSFSLQLLLPNAWEMDHFVSAMPRVICSILKCHIYQMHGHCSTLMQMLIYCFPYQMTGHRNALIENADM